jgi:hypothetical protein
MKIIIHVEQGKAGRWSAWAKGYNSRGLGATMDEALQGFFVKIQQEQPDEHLVEYFIDKPPGGNDAA